MIMSERVAQLQQKVFLMRGEYQKGAIRIELEQFFSEIKKRCMEECEKRVSGIALGGDGFVSVRPRSAQEIREAIDRMEIE